MNILLILGITGIIISSGILVILLTTMDRTNRIYRKKELDLLYLRNRKQAKNDKNI